MLVNRLVDHDDGRVVMEDRLLLIFRAFALVRLFLGGLFLILPPQLLTSFHWSSPVTLVETALLLIYLSVPALRIKLRGAYLPIAILWASLIPLLTQNVVLVREVERLSLRADLFPDIAVLQNTLIMSSVNETILIMIVPLIVVGWAYSRSVLAYYCVAIACVDVVTALVFVHVSPTLFLVALALIIFRTLLYAVIGVMINQIVSLQIEQQQRLVDANAKLREYAHMREQLATSRERNRLARELHDTLAHTLSAATVQLEAVSVIWDQQPDKAHHLVTRSAAMMRDGLEETRRALQALRTGSLEDANLLGAVKTLAQSLMTRYPMTIDVRAQGFGMLEQTNAEHGLYRIIQEALFNAVKHAGARHIGVNFCAAQGQLKIDVTDDGIGFEPALTNLAEHFGIRGMHERAQQIGADLEIASLSGKGTTVTVRYRYESNPHSDL